MPQLTLNNMLKKACDNSETLTRNELKFLLELENENDLQQLYCAAYSVKEKYIGKRVFLRGLIEFSNICTKDCYYCGIRKSNSKVDRFQLSMDEIISEARWTYEQNYGSLVLQSGERSDASFIDFVEEAVTKIKELSKGELGITLALGEQTKETYQRWRKAGAHRYLLRIESSTKNVYETIHPNDELHSFEQRANALKLIQECGFQTGTGVLIGFPNQTIDNLVDDVLFFKNIDIDMIGMGPYIAHHQTPMALAMDEMMGTFDEYKEHQLKLGLKMIAVCRLFLKDINIASTTALQALAPNGRELGLLAGGNVIMPNVTATEVRPSYTLYENKPGLDENCQSSRQALENSIHNIGEEICYGIWGDSAHFFERTK
ncbi:[FeFe] hydrogenase H-cluster radical SAM maturase HydE [Lentisphaerota bacterium WC36G]|nr:[FeFe] hydrogenase H-cluster radical SAM maturase HydE [Lentisphaerae bacterium WC36]